MTTKTVTITFKVIPEYYARYQLAARLADLDLSSWLREAAESKLQTVFVNSDPIIAEARRRLAEAEGNVVKFREILKSCPSENAVIDLPN